MILMAKALQEPIKLLILKTYMETKLANNFI